MNNPKWHSDGARRCFPPSPSPPSRTVTQLDFLSFSLPCCIFDEDRKKEGGGRHQGNFAYARAKRLVPLGGLQTGVRSFVFFVSDFFFLFFHRLSRVLLMT